MVSQVVLSLAFLLMVDVRPLIVFTTRFFSVPAFYSFVPEIRPIVF